MPPATPRTGRSLPGGPQPLSLTRPPPLRPPIAIVALLTTPTVPSRVAAATEAAAAGASRRRNAAVAVPAGIGVSARPVTPMPASAAPRLPVWVAWVRAPGLAEAIRRSCLRSSE